MHDVSSQLKINKFKTINATICEFKCQVEIVIEEVRDTWGSRKKFIIGSLK